MIVKEIVGEKRELTTLDGDATYVIRHCMTMLLPSLEKSLGCRYSFAVISGELRIESVKPEEMLADGHGLFSVLEVSNPGTVVNVLSLGDIWIVRSTSGNYDKHLISEDNDG